MVVESQSKRVSLMEASAQAIIGVPLGFSVTYAIGLLRLGPMALAVGVTSSMFVVSTIRGYIVRRRFERVAAISTALEERVQAAQDAVVYDHFEPLTSQNWEPPPFVRDGKRAPSE